MRRRPAGRADEWVLTQTIGYLISKDMQKQELTINRAHKLAKLFYKRAETAYVARYRSDVHGGLAPDRVRKAMDSFESAVELNTRVKSLLATLIPKIVDKEEKKSVTERLKGCQNMMEVQDVTKEYDIGPTPSDLQLAREFGMEAPAQVILKGEVVDMDSLISSKTNSLYTVQKYLKVALAELINRHPETIDVGREIIRHEGKATSPKVDLKVKAELTKKGKDLASLLHLTSEQFDDLDKETKKDVLKFRTYVDYVGIYWVSSLCDHKVRALDRAREDKVITWKVIMDRGEAKQVHPFYRYNIKVHPKMNRFFEEAKEYSLEHCFISTIQRRVQEELVKQDSKRAICVFEQKVEQLFEQTGIRDKYVIALDPGSVVKAAFLSPEGEVLEMKDFGFDTYYGPFTEYGINLLHKWSSQTEVKGENGVVKRKDLVIAIGNGLNSYNTQCAVSNMIQKKQFFKGIDVCFAVVPEHGASKYSITPAARVEFGDRQELTTKISAVSIGRSLIDPMSEYIKIAAQHLGKGQYKHLVSENRLKEKLEVVVRDRVSLNGVDLNLASEKLLANVCGLNEDCAKKIVTFRTKQRFKSRGELKKVVDEWTFRQCAGFLNVTDPGYSSSGWSKFDETRVHPDQYQVAEKLLERLNMTLEEVVEKNVSVPLTEKEYLIIELLKDTPSLRQPPYLMKKVSMLTSLEVESETQDKFNCLCTPDRSSRLREQPAHRFVNRRTAKGSTPKKELKLVQKSEDSSIESILVHGMSQNMQPSEIEAIVARRLEIVSVLAFETDSKKSFHITIRGEKGDFETTLKLCDTFVQGEQMKLLDAKKLKAKVQIRNLRVSKSVVQGILADFGPMENFERTEDGISFQMKPLNAYQFVCGCNMETKIILLHSRS